MRRTISMFQLVLLIITLVAYGVFIFMWFGPISKVPGDTEVQGKAKQTIEYYYGEYGD